MTTAKRETNTCKISSKQMPIHKNIYGQDKITKESVIVAAMLFLFNFYLGHCVCYTVEAQNF